MVEFYYNNVNFCEGYYWPKLLATSPSNLQIMSVLFSCKLISLSIWVAQFKTSIVLRFCTYSDANIIKRTKSDAQWTEVKALKCWSDENETKLEVWGQDSDSSHVHHFK